MPELDPNIILSAGNIQGPSQEQQTQGLVSMFSLAQAVKQQKQQDASQNALRQIFSDPASVDTETGLPNSNAIRKIMQVDPATGIKLQDASLEAQAKNLQIQHSKTEQGTTKFNFMSQVAGAGYDAYQDAKAAGKPEADAIAAGQSARNIAAKNGGGIVGDDVVDGITGTPFDPAGAKALALTNKEWSTAYHQEQGDAERNRHDEALEKLSARSQNIRVETGENSKWQVLTDPTHKDEKGNASPVQYRYNPETTQATTLDGKPYSPGGAARIGGGGSGSEAEFTPQMGALMAATAEQGVSLPTGFRSKAQQVELYQGLLDRNPDKTPDQIASMLKTGQIEFGAQKKETQTAANIAGKVQVFANELDKNLPLLRNAAKDVPRGNWVDLTKLIQTGDEHISDPKLKTLKGYINSTLQAYDGLGSRGGMDKDKREANRKLLLSADGPEAFEAQLKVFENEAKIAKTSAYEATKSPELDDKSGTKDSGGGPKIAAPTSKAEYDALDHGAHYSKPGDAPGTYRVKP